MARKRPSSTTQHRADDKKHVIEVLRQRGTLSDAARDTGVHRSTIYEWRDNDPLFAAELADAQDHVTDMLERTAVEMAIEGYSETTTIDDGTKTEVRTMHKRDPNMLRFMLGARRRSIYGQRQEIEHTGQVMVKRIVWGPEETLESEELADE